MKKVLKMFVLIALSLFATSAYSNHVEPKLNVSNSEEKILHIDGKELFSNAFDVRIQDINGQQLFSEYVTTPTTFTRNYNFSELENGVYLLQMEDNITIYTLPVIVQNDRLIVDRSKLEITSYTTTNG